MEKTLFSPQPVVSVLVHSHPWASAVSRRLNDVQLSWSLSMDTLLEEAPCTRSVAAILEFPPKSLEDLGTKLSRLSQVSPQLALFAVGDHGMKQWERLFHAAGFAGQFRSLLEIPNLIQAISRHTQAVSTEALSIEQRVQSQLPWATAAKPNQA